MSSFLDYAGLQILVSKIFEKILGVEASLKTNLTRTEVKLWKAIEDPVGGGAFYNGTKTISQSYTDFNELLFVCENAGSDTFIFNSVIRVEDIPIGKMFGITAGQRYMNLKFKDQTTFEKVSSSSIGIVGVYGIKYNLV